MRTPKGNRLHIAILGRRNAGKSALLNALTRQNVSIVSDVPGTTTDPVEKPMELHPIGPVVFIDTAGLDDAGALGAERVNRSRRVLDRTDLAVLVVGGGEWGEFEEELAQELARRRTPLVVAFNKSDLAAPEDSIIQRLQQGRIPHVLTCATDGAGLAALREAIIAAVPEEFLEQPTILGDLVPAGQLVVLVVPIDSAAPRGRLILPQVQTIRDALDHDVGCLVVREHALRDALQRLRTPPALVVTDSQAFQKVAADTPADVPMTSFSILFARLKGDLAALVRGARAIDSLRPGDRILVCEACSHQATCDDIGRAKIPAWLERYVGGPLRFTHYQGYDFPDDLGDFRLAIHCGACVHNRRSMLTRIQRCQEAGVPITNYGLTIAYTLGIFERALRPFPDALAAFHESCVSPTA